MPIYVYKATDSAKSCEYCKDSFEIMQSFSDDKLKKCPKCKSPIQKVITNVSAGLSVTSLDDRAKSSGFHKLKRLGHGEYEKLY